MPLRQLVETPQLTRIRIDFCRSPQNPQCPLCSVRCLQGYGFQCLLLIKQTLRIDISESNVAEAVAQD